MPEDTASETQTAAQPSMNILAQFIRDISFENYLAKKGIIGEVAPSRCLAACCSSLSVPV